MEANGAPASAHGDRTRSRPPWQVVVSLVGVLLAIGAAAVLGVAKRAHPETAAGPLPVATVGQPGADSAACRTLMAALPGTLAAAGRRQVEGGGSGVAAWGDPAVILRCGIESPEDLTCSSSLIQVDGVSWLQLSEAGFDSTTYIAADRSVRIALTVPGGSGTAAIGQISAVVAVSLTVRAPCRLGVLLPTDTQ